MEFGLLSWLEDDHIGLHSPVLEVERIRRTGVRLDADRLSRGRWRVNHDVGKLPPIELHDGLNLIHVVIQKALHSPGRVGEWVRVNVVQKQTGNITWLSQIEPRIQIQHVSGGQAV